MRLGILVVDDDELTRIMVRDFLLRGGFDVFSAKDNKHALDVLAQEGESVRLVITDHSMPIAGDGVKLLHCIRELRPELAVILMSGCEFGPDDSIHREGFDAIMVKGSHREALVSFVKTLISDH